MEQTRAYIANFGEHSEGGSVGAWFTPLVDSDEMKERIGLNDEYKEYVTHDYEPSFEIDEYTPTEEINRLCDLAEELEGTPVDEVASEIRHAFFNPFEEVAEYVDSIICYPNHDDMSGVAYLLIVEAGDFGEIPEHLKMYIDSDACSRDLEIGGNYLVTSRGVFEYPYQQNC